MAQDIIKHFPTIETVTEEMAKDFIAVTNKYIHDTGHCIVGITGGTAINALLEVLNNNDNIDSVDWEHIFFLWTDERFVPQSNPDNYFSSLKPTLLCKIRGAAHFLPIDTNGKTVLEAAENYEKEVRTVLKHCQKTAMDLVILDLGSDGHTAGLFAGSHALRELNHEVVPVEDGKVWERITMTFQFLAKTETVWFTVVGDAKRSALSKVINQRWDYEDTPWEERIGRVLPGAVLSQATITWYVDDAAYKK